MINQIVKPNEALIADYIAKHDNNAKHSTTHKAIKKLIKNYPKNTELDEVLLKVCTINSTYNTQIFDPFSAAKHIIENKVDSQISEGDEKVIDKIAKMTIADKERNNYSFATKYCHWHNPECYPIYDSYVRKILIEFNKNFNFYKFKNSDFSEYDKFKSILSEFKKFFKLDFTKAQDMDKFLWLYGKEYFSIKNGS